MTTTIKPKDQRIRKLKRLEARVTSLRGEAREAFVNAILNPSAPNQALRAAAQRYKKQMGL